MASRAWWVMPALVLVPACRQADTPEAAAFKSGQPPAHGVIPAQVAGSYYPLGAEALAARVKALLDAAGAPAPGPVAALVVPRAGYAFAGETLASAFAAVRDRRFSRVVILGASPQVAPGSAVLPESRAMSTPLGELAVDPGAAALLATQPGFSRSDQPYRGDHSIEVALPFIQVALGQVPIVPVEVGPLDVPQARALSGVLAQVLDSSSLLVVSTDITACGPRFKYTPFGDVAPNVLKAHLTQADEVLLNPVLTGDLDGFDALARQNRNPASGQDALRLLLAVLPRPTSSLLRKYDLSFNHDATEHVDMVSYAAILFKGVWPDVAPFSAGDRRALTDAAHAAMQSRLTGAPLPPPEHASSRLLEHRGVFVTVVSHGEVKSCVGRVVSDEPLMSTVEEVAASALGADGGSSLGAADLQSAEVEVSVLGGLHPVRDLLEVRPGIDGLLVQVEGHEGVLLPSEDVGGTGSREEMVERLVAKSEIPRSRWTRDSLKSFTTQEVREAAAADAGRP